METQLSNIIDVKNMVVNEEEIIKWRHYLHMHPEISGQEKKTAAFVEQTLKSMGLKVNANIFENGLVAVLEGDPTKKCVAIRADMDALPIQEQNDFSYSSQNQGAMHACGHDGHMAIVLGVARALTKNPPAGSAKFIFQPREEKPPGGAKYMVENGVLKNPDVDAILGCHVNPNYPLGTIALKNDTIMAVADDFKLVIRGKGGHGSSPHVTIDPIVVAAEAIVALQTVASRLNNPMEPLVITIATIHGGTAQNIIPDEVQMTGTLRCLNNKTRDYALNHMHQTLRGLTDAWGANYQLDFLYGYPPLNNDAGIMDVVRDVITDLKAKDFDIRIEEMPYSLLAGEDFAYYSEAVPAAYFMLGCQCEGKCYPWHHSCFHLNEKCLAIGVNVMANAITYLASEDKAPANK